MLPIFFHKPEIHCSIETYGVKLAFFHFQYCHCLDGGGREKKGSGGGSGGWEKKKGEGLF